MAEERGIIKPTAWKVEPETKRAEAPDDLIAEAKEFWANYKAPGYTNDENQLVDIATLLASFARQREGKVIDEFVERVKEEYCKTCYHDYEPCDCYGDAMRSVAAEMKQEKNK